MATANPFAGAQAKTQQRKVALRRRELQHVKVYVPDIKMTHAQRVAADDIVVKGLRKQGVNLADATDLAALPKAAQRQVQAVVQRHQRAQQRVNEEVAKAKLQPTASLPKGYTRQGDTYFDPKGMPLTTADASKLERHVAAAPKTLTREQKKVRKEILKSPNPRQALAGYGEQVAASHRAQAKAGPGPSRLKVQIAGIGPNINLTQVGRAIGSVTTLDKGDLGPREMANNALNDAVGLGTAPFVAGATLAQAGVKGIKENPWLAAVPLGFLAAPFTTKEGQALAKGVGRGFVDSVPGHLVRGDLKGAGKAAREHPLYAALDLAGASGAAGRGLGALSRGVGAAEGAGVRGALGRIGSTSRPVIALTDDIEGVKGGLVAEQPRYSKALDRKGILKAKDAQREPLLEKDGTPVTVRRAGKDVPVLKPFNAAERNHLLKQRGDFVSDRNVATQRQEREKGVKQESQLIGETWHGVKMPAPLRSSPKKVGEELASVIGTGTVRSGAHLAEDLEKRLVQLNAEYARHQNALAKGDLGESPFRNLHEVELNRHQADLFESALLNPKVMRHAGKIAEVSAKQMRALNEHEAEAVRLGLLGKDQAERARLMEYAMAHMDAEHVTVKEHARLEKRARSMENEAAARVEATVEGSPERRAAQQDLREARDTRIAVSGKDPALVQRHEGLQAENAKRKQAAKAADAKVARLEKTRARTTGAQAVQRGHDLPRGPETNPVFRRRLVRDADRAGKLEKIDKLLERAKRERKDAHKAWRETRQQLRRTKPPKARAALRKSDGTFLSNADIIADIEKYRGKGGADTIGFLPHSDEVLGNAAYYQQFSPGTRPNLGKSGTRTGAAYARGANPVGRQAVADQFARLSTQIAKAHGLDDLAGSSVMRHPAWAKAQRGEELTDKERRIVDQGGLFTRKEAGEVTKNIRLNMTAGAASGKPVPILVVNGEEFVPITVYGAKLERQMQRIIREDLQNPRAMEGLELRLLNDRVLTVDELGKKGGARNVGLMPKALYDRLEKHMRPAGDIQRFFQMTNRAFRMAVLPQPRWLAGNFIEPYLVRLPVAGSGVTNLYGLAIDIRAAHKVLRRMERSGDPRLVQAAKEIRAQQLGGLFVSGNRSVVRRTIGEGLPAGASKAYHAMVAKLPAVGHFLEFSRSVIRTLAAPLRGYFQLNRAIELGPQMASLGKSIRADVADFTGSVMESVRLGEKAADEAARGLLNTSTQQRYLREQHVLLGKYSGYDPIRRTLIQTAFPFIPWMMSAARFVYWTMPVHHTLLTDVLLKTAAVVDQEWQLEHDDAPPGDLAFALRRKDGGFVDLARYTPFSVGVSIKEGEFTDVTNQAFPQLSGGLAAFAGRDPFGRDLKVKGGKAPTAAQKFWIAMNATAEAVVPYLSTTRRIREGGGTAWADSTALSPKTKPGSARGGESLGHALNRTFNPIRPTYLSGEAGKVISSPGGGGGGNSGIDDLLQETSVERSGGGGGVDKELEQLLLETSAVRHR